MKIQATIAALAASAAWTLLAFAAPPQRANAPKPAATDADGGDMMSMQDMSMSGPSSPKHPPTKGPALTKPQLDFFETKVRPLLASKCYECHSAEQRKSKGGLTLDTKEGWQKGGKHGPALVPSNPGKSLLLKAVGYTDEDLQMPPDEKMSDAEIAILRQWVQMGAPDPRVSKDGSKLTGLTPTARNHWAFKPVRDVSLPAVKDTTWPKAAVDTFVLKKLEAADLKPSPPAPKEALIRRATYDLTGLPPTPEEVAAFVADPSPTAFEQVVDRLLASPHFGERWGRFWLDTARYSDTTGGDDRRNEYRYPFAWTYRDYVINAYNSDKPYDVFIKEQLAADLLPSAKSHPASLAALGFITVGKRFQNPNDTIDERIDAVTKSTLGLTVACARCHDHKFDPIPTADYYSLHGVFNSIEEPTEKPLVGTPPDPEAFEEFKKELAALEQKNRDAYYKLVGDTGAEFRKKATAYLTYAALGRSQDADKIKERNQIVVAEKLDRAIYQYAPRYIRQDNAVFAPLFALARLDDDGANFAQAAKPILLEAANGGSRRRPLNPLVARAFATANKDQIKSIKDVAAIYGKLFADIDEKAHAYLEACKTAKTKVVPGYPPELVDLFNVPAEIDPAPALTTDRLTELAPRLPVVNGRGYDRLVLGQINELFLTHPGSPPRAMVVEDLEKPRNSPVFIRGEASNRGPVVQRQFLEILSGPNRQPFKIGSGRLELATAIASKSNPLTARVHVNRVWMHLFGQAFVRTPDDLGVQCEQPSHPELLDFLARQFMNQNWSTKRLIRSIMLSRTYQQSSDTRPEAAAIDSENRLLWRANLRRLDFEAVRDSMLMFTGKLDLTLGGKPVNLTDEPYSNRRSVYGYIDRGSLPELMQQFDYADPDMANSRRTSTIVPQQALFFMNSPMAVDVARKVTSRPEFATAKDDTGRVTALYEVLFQRPPRPEEINLAIDFIEESTADALAEAARLSPGDAKKAAAAAKAAAARAAKPVAKKYAGARRAITNEGSLVERKPLTPWEQYAQALLFTNEIAYQN